MHEMRLHNSPFKLIKSGTKTIEMRLNDEKRQLIKVGDSIKFIYREDEEADPNDMSQYYSKDDILKYGVVGIEIEVTK